MICPTGFHIIFFHGIDSALRIFESGKESNVKYEGFRTAGQAVVFLATSP